MQDDPRGPTMNAEPVMCHGCAVRLNGSSKSARSASQPGDVVTLEQVDRLSRGNRLEHPRHQGAPIIERGHFDHAPHGNEQPAFVVAPTTNSAGLARSGGTSRG